MGVQTYINRHGQNKWSHVSPGFICFSSFSSLACMPEMCLICEVALVSPCNADTGSRDSHHNEFTDFNLDQIPGWAFDRIEGMSRMYRSDFRARSKAVNLCGWEWSVDEIPTRISPLSQINYHLSKNNVDFFLPTPTNIYALVLVTAIFLSKENLPVCEVYRSGWVSTMPCFNRPLHAKKQNTSKAQAISVASNKSLLTAWVQQTPT